MIIRRRPSIPASYDIATDEAGMLEWNDVAGAIASAPVYWVATTTPAGNPHLIPIWGAWVDDAAYIEGGDDTRWARNLAAGDGRIQIGIDHEGMQIMVRGTATKQTLDPATQQIVANCFAAKYPYRPTGAEFWTTTARTVLAWRTDDIDLFATTPTQFDLGGEA
jgi:hypothetical protein